jgi:CRP-like cAMP-binding protein
MNHSDRLALLTSVSFFAELGPDALSDVAARAEIRRYAAGKRIVSELEFGADLFVLAQGQAEVSVQPRQGEKQLLGTIGPGATFGEMASLSGELRSASVIALSPVEALVISSRDFDRLRARRPEVAAYLVRTLATRLGEADRTLETLLGGTTGSKPPPPNRAPRRSLGALWREMVVNHHKDLAFLTLAAFVLALVVVRLAVYLSFAYDLAPREVLRVAYLTGFGLLLTSSCAALFTFRPTGRRAVAFAFGVGAALIFNELGVTLAFDIFFKDMHTPDPTLAFDVERLYRRAEPLRAVVIGLIVLVQAAYLRRFYARAWFLLGRRFRKVMRLEQPGG